MGDHSMLVCSSSSELLQLYSFLFLHQLIHAEAAPAAGMGLKAGPVQHLSCSGSVIRACTDETKSCTIVVSFWYWIGIRLIRKCLISLSPTLRCTRGRRGSAVGRSTYDWKISGSIPILPTHRSKCSWARH